jgi:hypothetical protein
MISGSAGRFRESSQVRLCRDLSLKAEPRLPRSIRPASVSRKTLTSSWTAMPSDSPETRTLPTSRAQPSPGACGLSEARGGQSQNSALLAAQAQSDSDTFTELEQWIAEHLKGDLRVEALAERAHMRPRIFARLYVKMRVRTARSGRCPKRPGEKPWVDAFADFEVVRFSRIGLAFGFLLPP